MQRSDLAADGNGDSQVDGADLQIWQNHFGEPTAANGMSHAVPEPATAALLILATAGGWRFR